MPNISTTRKQGKKRELIDTQIDFFYLAVFASLLQPRSLCMNVFFPSWEYSKMKTELLLLEEPHPSFRLDITGTSSLSLKSTGIKLIKYHTNQTTNN